MEINLKRQIKVITDAYGIAKEDIYKPYIGAKYAHLLCGYLLRYKGYSYGKIAVILKQKTRHPLYIGMRTSHKKRLQNDKKYRYTFNKLKRIPLNEKYLYQC
jgi:hypothetical protein